MDNPLESRAKQQALELVEPDRAAIRDPVQAEPISWRQLAHALFENGHEVVK
jgi:hypothetical protein